MRGVGFKDGIKPVSQLGDASACTTSLRSFTHGVDVAHALDAADSDILTHGHGEYAMTLREDGGCLAEGRLTIRGQALAVYGDGTGRSVVQAGEELDEGTLSAVTAQS